MKDRSLVVVALVGALWYVRDHLPLAIARTLIQESGPSEQDQLFLAQWIADENPGSVLGHDETLVNILPGNIGFGMFVARWDFGGPILYGTGTGNLSQYFMQKESFWAAPIYVSNTLAAAVLTERSAQGAWVVSSYGDASAGQGLTEMQAGDKLVIDVAYVDGWYLLRGDQIIPLDDAARSSLPEPSMSLSEFQEWVAANFAPPEVTPPIDIAGDGRGGVNMSGATDVHGNGVPTPWIIVLGGVAIVAGAVVAMRRRGRSGNSAP